MASIRVDDFPYWTLQSKFQILRRTQEVLIFSSIDFLGVP
jgi:hypothetical protein